MPPPKEWLEGYSEVKRYELLFMSQGIQLAGEYKRVAHEAGGFEDVFKVDA